MVSSDYKIVQGSGVEVEKKVNELLADGYTLVGQPIALSSNGGWLILQAMLRVNSPKKKKTEQATLVDNGFKL
jgi:hypothetical protein